MPDTEYLLRRLIAGDESAAADVLDRARSGGSPALLVAAALVSPEPHDYLSRAAATAVTSRDRQLVAIAGAHLAGQEDLFDALVRDHLSDYPDNVLAAWIAGQHTRPNR